MGQSKSKVGALPGVDDQDGAVLKARKSNKRKWRKSKGYSLSASLEGDLHCNEEERQRGLNPKNGLVLVSYSVTDLENKQECTERRNSLPSKASPPSRLVSRERGAGEWVGEEEENKKLEDKQAASPSPPLAEGEGDLSCYSTPARSLPCDPPSPPPLKSVTTISAEVTVASTNSRSPTPLTHISESQSVESFTVVEEVGIPTESAKPCSQVISQRTNQTSPSSAQKVNASLAPSSPDGASHPSPLLNVPSVIVANHSSHSLSSIPPIKEAVVEATPVINTLSSPSGSSPLSSSRAGNHQTSSQNVNAGTIITPPNNPRESISSPNLAKDKLPSPLESPASPRYEVKELLRSSVTFAEPEDGDAGAPGELNRPSSPTREVKLAREEACSDLPTPTPHKRQSVVVSNQESRLSVPVPTNISDILQSGLATVAFLEGMPADVEDEASEHEEESDLDVIVQPPLIFSGRPSPADFPQLDNSESGGRQNADEVLQAKRASPANSTDAARPTTSSPNPLPVESETARWQQGHEGHEWGRRHEIAEDAQRKSALAASISPETISTEVDEERQSGESSTAGSNGEMAEVSEAKEVSDRRRVEIDKRDGGVGDACSSPPLHLPTTPKQSHNNKAVSSSSYTTVSQLREMLVRSEVLSNNSSSSAAAPVVVEKNPHRAECVGGGEHLAASASQPLQLLKPPEQTAAGESNTVEDLRKRPSAEMGLAGSKSSDRKPKGERGLSPPVTGVVPSSVASRSAEDGREDASGELLGWVDASPGPSGHESEQSSELSEKSGKLLGCTDAARTTQFGAESEQSETFDEYNNACNISGRQRIEPRAENFRSRVKEVGGTEGRSRGGLEDGTSESRIGDDYQAELGGKRSSVPVDDAGLSGGEGWGQEGSRREGSSCNGSVRDTIGMHQPQEACPGNYVSQGEQEHAEESCPLVLQPQASDKNSIPPSCDDGSQRVENSNLDQIGKLKVEGLETGGGVETNCDQGSSTRRRIVSFSLDLVGHQDVEIVDDQPSSPSSEELSSDSLTEETPKLGSRLLSTGAGEEEAEPDCATLSDISPISDFAALPELPVEEDFPTVDELPVEEEWASLAEEAARAQAGMNQLPGGLHAANGTLYANEDEDRTIMDDHTDVSFSLPMDPIPSQKQNNGREELTDSCLDLTSPTPSQSTSTDSRGSWHQFALAQSGYSARLPPQGCSGSSEEDEGAGLEEGDSGEEEECYDSLEDLKRGAGVRRLPPVPTAQQPARRELARSQTFNSTPSFNSAIMTAEFRSEQPAAGRRKLPQVPPRAVSVAGRQDPGHGGGLREEQRGRRAVSMGRELPQRRSRHEFEDKIRSPDTSLDSGCHSFETYGEETSVDPPSLEKSLLLPRRNQSNFLWVDFQEEKPGVVRRPKNHDRLLAARKAANRHSAPPGSLETENSTSVGAKQRSSLGSRRLQGLSSRRASSGQEAGGQGTWYLLRLAMPVFSKI